MIIAGERISRKKAMRDLRANANDFIKMYLDLMNRDDLTSEEICFLNGIRNGVMRDIRYWKSIGHFKDEVDN